MDREQLKMLPRGEVIKIRGANEHNLKNIDLDIPRNKFVVLTGLSGSGKSSLAFDTIYAEGQRRYMESLSSYARQFLGQMEKPNVERIDGLSPAISIDQKSTNRSRHSHGDLRLFQAPVCAHRHTALPKLRQGDQAADDRPDGRPDHGAAAGHETPASGAGRARQEGGARQGA